MRRCVVKAGMRVALGLACFSAITAPAQASASSAEKEAKRALRAVEYADEGGAPKLEPTIALRDLALALPELNGAAEDRARSILTRPPAGDAGAAPYGGKWPSNAEEMFVKTPSFIVHYAEVPDCDVNNENCDEPDLTDGPDANDIPDYVDRAVEATDASIQVENGELGWPEPKGDGDEGEPQGSTKTDRFDVYLSDLCGFNSCVFGYAQPDDGSAECNGAPFLCSAHLVLDNDYEEFGESGGLLGLRVTTAHEYNHALQFNLDSNQDTWMFESTATWSEEQVFPADDDWVRSYMDTWARTPTGPMTSTSPGDGLRIYGSAIWNHWLENGDNSFGPDVILNAWESSRDVTPKDYAVGAYDDAILDEGGAGFSQEFSAFTAATAEWNTGDGNLPDAAELPDVKRLAQLELGDESQKQTLDNTSYALFDVDPKDAAKVTLKGRLPGGGVRWGLSLVGRTGGRFDGTPTRIVAYSVGDERQVATLPDAQTYSRITAVVTNADGRVAGSKPTFGEFNYTQDDKEFRVKVR